MPPGIVIFQRAGVLDPDHAVDGYQLMMAEGRIESEYWEQAWILRTSSIFCIHAGANKYIILNLRTVRGLP